MSIHQEMAERYLNNAKQLRHFADTCKYRTDVERFINDAIRYEKLAMHEFEAETSSTNLE